MLIPCLLDFSVGERAFVIELSQIPSLFFCLWPKKVTGTLEVAVTYFMTPKEKVTFEVGLT